MQILDMAAQRARAAVWDGPLADLPAWRAGAVNAARILWVVIRDIVDGQIGLRAMGLVYTTLLSLVPVLALTFAVLKAFDVDNQIETAMLEFLAPLGGRGVEITQQTMEFVRDVNIGVLGSAGFAFLLYMLVSMIYKIEAAFNAIWRVRPTRSLPRRVTEFLGVGLLGPLLVFTAIGIMATAIGDLAIGGVLDAAPIKFLAEQINRLVPYAIVVGGFTLLYFAIPNTRVTLAAAFTGGAVAGVVWGAVGWTFAAFVVTSARYAAVYSAFASLVLLMLWLYAAWLILLTGCSVSFYFQNRRYLSPETGVVAPTAAQLERLALQVLVLLHQGFERGGTPWTEDSLAQRLHIPAGAMTGIVEALGAGQMVTRTADQPAHLVPTRPAERTPVADVLAAMRRRKEGVGATDAAGVQYPAVEHVFEDLADARVKALHGLTVADLLGPASRERDEAAAAE